jgi:hypothetical protein
MDVGCIHRTPHRGASGRLHQAYSQPIANLWNVSIRGWLGHPDPGHLLRRTLALNGGYRAIR